MTHPTQILSLATASPPHVLRQDEVLAAANEAYGAQLPQFERMAPVVLHAGGIRRRMAMPIEWYLEPRTWPERSAAYEKVALDLFCEAAGKALDDAGLTSADADIIVTVSSTGMSTPSLEARAMTRLGFRSDAARVPVFGLGCAGGASGLALAARLAQAEPGARVLLVCVELCSLAFRIDNLTKADVVSAAIFADGAAACVLASNAEGGFAAVTGCAEHTWPGTLDIMGWKAEPSGFGVVLARALPPFIRKELKPAMEGMLAKQGLQIGDIDRFICHP